MAVNNVCTRITYARIRMVDDLRKLLIALGVCSQLVAIQLLILDFAGLVYIGDGVKNSWNFIVEYSGRTKVSLTTTNIDQSEIGFSLPKTYQDLRITPMLNYTIKPLSGRCCDELNIKCKNIGQINLSYIWPDGAVLYKGAFYFAAQEKPLVAHAEVAIRLPNNCSVFWIEGYNDFTGNITDELIFKADMIQPVPSFGYSFPSPPRFEFTSETSEHVNLHYHQSMEGKPWINRTIEIVEEQWSWMKTTMNGTLNHVNITFAPYGHNDLGTKWSGLCYPYSRSIEVVATRQFGIGFSGEDTALILHELTHALTPLLEDLPAFYSEAIAQDFAYDVLRRTELNASADSCEEAWFTCAYEYGVQEGLFDYIWL